MHLICLSALCSTKLSSWLRCQRLATKNVMVGAIFAKVCENSTFDLGTCYLVYCQKYRQNKLKFMTITLKEKHDTLKKKNGETKQERFYCDEIRER